MILNLIVLLGYLVVIFWILVEATLSFIPSGKEYPLQLNSAQVGNRKNCERTCQVFGTVNRFDL